MTEAVVCKKTLNMKEEQIFYTIVKSMVQLSHTGSADAFCRFFLHAAGCLPSNVSSCCDYPTQRNAFMRFTHERQG